MRKLSKYNHFTNAFFLSFCTLDFAFAASSGKCGFAPLNKEFSRFDTMLPEHRLVGGIESQPHSWPWTGQILYRGNHNCGCALYDKQFVLTAAHCFARSRRPMNYKVMLGGHEIFSGETMTVVSISIHPLYQIRVSAYDLALVRISPPVEFNETISPICLPIAPPLNHRICVVTGWGRLNENGDRAKALREIHVPIIPPWICNNGMHYGGRIHSASMICAGYNTGRIDSCQGDSGGPLQCQNAQGVWELQGVVSWGIGCAQPSFPGVYSKIFAMNSWIRAQTSIMAAMKTVVKKE